MKKIIGSSLTLSLLLLGCGQIDEQPIGESMSGSSGAGGSGQAQAGTGGMSGAPTGEECGGAICAAGSECFVAKGATNADGVCVPLCNPADQTDQSTWGQPCSGAVGGGVGVCRPFLRNVSLGAGIGEAHTGVGVCTHPCDPLAQDCAAGFSCTLTDTPNGTVAVWSYACLPVLTPIPIGGSCLGLPVGACVAGAVCGEDGKDYACREFCDSEASDPCPGGQACEVPTWFPAGSSVGVCVGA